jgi:hypothetical protein
MILFLFVHKVIPPTTKIMPNMGPFYANDVTFLKVIFSFEKLLIANLTLGRLHLRVHIVV